MNKIYHNIFYHKFLEENSIVSITDKDGKIICVNKKFCEISKYSRSDLIGANHRIIKSGFHSKDFFRNMWETISKGETWRGEVCNRAKDGSLYWVESFVKPEINKQGKIVKYYSFRILISERKIKEEEEFYSTVSKLGTIFENSQGFQFFINKHHKLVSFNKAGATIPNISRGSAVCSCENDNLLNFNAFLQNFDTHLKKSLSGKEIKIEQKVDFFNNGKIKWFLVTYFPIKDSNKKTIGVTLTAIDIHKRKEAELALKLAYEQKNALIESIPDPIFFKDGEGRWLIINAAAQALCQLEGYQWVNKTDLQMGMERPELKNMFNANFKRDEITWATGKPTEAIEFVKQGGAMAEFNVNKYPIYYKDGRRKALIIHYQNITERTFNLEILKKKNKQLNQIAWLQAHKARAPVARIMGLASIFNLNKIQDPINKEVLARMVKSAQELDDVIHKIMDYAQEDYLLKED